MVTERTTEIKLTGFEKLGEFLGGVKQGFVTTAKGEQAEAGALSKGGGTGAVLSKALLGKEGMGGLKETMKGVGTKMIPLSGAMAKGGAIGAMGAGVGMIVGFLGKALGSSGIFSGVAGSFWKIAGIMIDMLLMPMLPYLMKFLQFMLTTILPLFQEIGKALGAMFSGDMAPLFKVLMKVIKLAMWDIPNIIRGAILKALWGAMKGIFQMILPDWLLKGGGGGGGFGGGMARRMMGGGGSMPSPGGGATETANHVSGFYDSAAKDGEKVARAVGGATDRAKHQVKKDGEQFVRGAITTSWLKDTHEGVSGFWADLAGKGGGVKDSIFGWLDGIDWTIFDIDWGGILGGIWGAITGFFTGKDDEGKEVSPSIPGMLRGIGESINFPAIADFGATLGNFVWTVAQQAWWKIEDFFTCEIPNKIPTWEDIWSTITGWWDGLGSLAATAGTKLKEKAVSIWGTWGGSTTHMGQTIVTDPTGVAGVIPNMIAKLPSWSGIWSKLTEWWNGLEDIATKAGTLAKDWASGIWGSWDLKTGIAGFLPRMWENLKDVGSSIMSGLGDLFTMDLGLMTGQQVEKLKAQFGNNFSSLHMGQESDDHKFGGNAQGLYQISMDIGQMVKGIGHLLKEKVMAPIRWVQEKWEELKNLSFDDVKSWSMGKLDFLGKIGKTIANKIIGALNNAITWIIEQWNELIVKDFKGFGLPNWITDNISIDPGSFQIPTIGSKQIGGLIPGGPGDKVPAILHGGEYVVPSHLVKSLRGGGGGGVGSGSITTHNQSFNININSSFSPGDILRSITQSGAVDETAYLNTVS